MTYCGLIPQQSAKESALYDTDEIDNGRSNKKKTAIIRKVELVSTLSLDAACITITGEDMKIRIIHLDFVLGIFEASANFFKTPRSIR